MQQTTIFYLFFLFFRENKSWHFMWIVCLAKKKKKKIGMSSATNLAWCFTYPVQDLQGLQIMVVDSAEPHQTMRIWRLIWLLAFTILVFSHTLTFIMNFIPLCLFFLSPLTLKAPRKLHLKMLSVYVICWIFLQTFQTYFCIQANSVDPD